MAVKKPVGSNQDTVVLDLPGFAWTVGARLFVNKVLHEDVYDDNAINDIANWLYGYCEGNVSRLDSLVTMLTERTDELFSGLETLATVVEGVEQLGNYAGGWDRFSDLPSQVDNNGKITPPKTGIAVQLSTNDFVTVRVNDNPAHNSSSASAIEKEAYNKQVRYVVTAIANKHITWSFDIKYDTDVTYLEDAVEALQREVETVQDDLTRKMDKIVNPDSGKIVISLPDGNVEESNFTFENIDKRISLRVNATFTTPIIGTTINVDFGGGNETLCSHFKPSETILFDAKGVAAIVTSVNGTSVSAVIVATSGFDDIPNDGEKDYVRSRDDQGNVTWKDATAVTDDYVKKSGDTMTGDLAFQNSASNAWIYFKQGSTIQEGDKRFGRQGSNLIRQTYTGGTWVTYGNEDRDSEWEVIPLTN